jgi:putative ABC transport system permease protein
MNESIASLWRNLRYAFRQLRKSPGFSFLVVTTLALGIGANSAVFSAIDAVLLRPLPFPHPTQLTRILQHKPKTPGTNSAPIRLAEWDKMNSVFQGLTGYYTDDISEISGELPERLKRAFVAPRFLEVWGIAPSIGRDFTPEEGHFGGPNAMLISDRYWRRRFGAAPDVLGKTLRVGTASYTVIGVLPASFGLLENDIDLWSPVPVGARYTESRESIWYTTIGRLKPGISVAQARANLATVQAQLGVQFPKTDGDITIDVEPLRDSATGGLGRGLWVLFGSVSLLLLIACINVASLLLVRSTQREREISIRVSMGASRRTVIAQLLTETLVLAFAGAGAGLLLASFASTLFRKMAAAVPLLEAIRLDGRIVAYTLCAAVLVTIACGLLPAIRATRRDISSILAQGGRGQVSGRHPLQWILAGAQVALAVLLLAGAGLLLRSFRELGKVSPGFDPAHVLTFHISGSWNESVDYPGIIQRIDRTLDFLRALPGVQEASTAYSLPGVPQPYDLGKAKVLEGKPDEDAEVAADNRTVSKGYFATMQIPLIAGEACREIKGARSVVVNRSFANRYFADSSPLGHHLALASTPGPPGVIQGIVGDAREQGLNREPYPTAYWCFNAPTPFPFFLVRTAGAPQAMSETIRRKIFELEPRRSVYDILPLEAQLDAAFAESRLRAILLTSFAITALLLACVGLYGTLSYLVTIHRKEVGLRLALGALPGQIAGRFLAQGLRASILGSIAGLGLSLLLTRLLAGMLYGVSASDPETLGAVVLIMFGVAALASLLPAIRAARLDPIVVLRQE